MRYNLLFSSTLIFITLSSCFKSYEKVDIEIKEASPQKLVMVATLNNNSHVLSVYLSRTQNLFSNTNKSPQVPDATVTITDGLETLTLKRVEQLHDTTSPPTFESSYEFSYYEYIFNKKGSFLQQGKTYILKAETPAGEYAFASCTIPNTDILNLKINKNEKRVKSSREYLVISLDVSFKTAKPTYIKSYGYIRAIDTIYIFSYMGNGIPYYTSVIDTFNYTLSENFRGSPNSSIPWDLPSNQFNIQMDAYYPVTSFKTTPKIIDIEYEKKFVDRIRSSGKIIDYHIVLEEYDEHYFKYKQTVNVSDPNIFSEPSNVYTNVTNGFGVVTGQSRTTIFMPYD